MEVTDPDEDDDDDMGTLIIGLMQKETRKRKAKTGLDLLTVGYLIYQVGEMLEWSQIYYILLALY